MEVDSQGNIVFADVEREIEFLMEGEKDNKKRGQTGSTSPSPARDFSGQAPAQSVSQDETRHNIEQRDILRFEGFVQRELTRRRRSS